jgi:hypothetical protein
MAMSSFFAESSLLLGDDDTSEGGLGSCAWNVTVGKCCPGDSFMSVSGVNSTATCCALCAAVNSGVAATGASSAPPNRKRGCRVDGRLSCTHAGGAVGTKALAAA